jgi:hypothetical protein
MAVSAQERRYLLGQVNRLAEQDLNTLWAQADQQSDADFFTYIVTAYPLVVDPYIDMSANLAATWFELADPDSTYRAVMAPNPPVEQLAANARWALKATGTQGRIDLTGSLNRAVFDGARETTRLNVLATDSKWAVDARPTACPWCRMMATRGAVYKKEATALAACHDNGHCVAIEDRTGDYEPPDHVQMWEDEYNKARAEAGTGNPKDIQAAWRQLLKTEE